MGIKHQALRDSAASEEVEPLMKGIILLLESPVFFGMPWPLQSRVLFSTRKSTHLPRFEF